MNTPSPSSQAVALSAQSDSLSEGGDDGSSMNFNGLGLNFEPSEVGMLARCLCIPLVSMRVGKIKKQGMLLCPTATR
ncbi:hypothetical protein HAX54_038313 [Datura stramonium]|uniref:Uncharacterized protein n=1 Tax=Datura stramonium TaxID=4076 RepID=A0ABS8VLA4_DATST|nr:hypothetical protein [Datura stramonium]